MTRIDDITLMAYADGELGEDEARAVERAVKDDPGLQAQMESLRETGVLLEKIYGPVLEEQTPTALLESIGGKLGEGNRWRQPKTWMAMAASIAIVVSAGLLTRDLVSKQEKTVLAEAVDTTGGDGKSGVAPLPPTDDTSTDRSEERVAPKEPVGVLAEKREIRASLSARSADRVTPSGAKPRAAPESTTVVQTNFSRLAAYQNPSDPRQTEPQVEGSERYQEIEGNSVRQVAETPVSTFSIDVDTGSYANIRRFLDSGQLPPTDAVRLEEMLNYFDYAYAAPESRETPFSITTDMVPAFWNHDLRLLRIGLKGYEVPDAQRPAANLVFLIDASGSMREPRKLPLLKTSLKLLAGKLNGRDRISIVAYAGQAGVVLEPVSGDDKAAINSAIDRLAVGGSTAGGAGLRLAYEMASRGYITDGINRILLATDGDFNVGVLDIRELKGLVADKRRDGVSLTTLGFGSGNYNEALMEQIADVGDGNYSYIDSLKEARKVLVGELNSTLMTIARDVKIQVEFNPAVVAEYRLIGYENRVLRREDFSNDKVDAGDLGSGHTVTALYELVLSNAGGARMDPLRYGEQQMAKGGNTDELAFARLRYKLPGESKSRLIEVPLPASMAGKTIAEASDDLRFAGAVAAFGQILRGGTYTGDFSYADVVALARGAYGADPHGYRREFVGLVEAARDLDVNQRR
jgi:Ca-activated chloride channel homolog